MVGGEGYRGDGPEGGATVAQRRRNMGSMTAISFGVGEFFWGFLVIFGYLYVLSRLLMADLAERRTRNILGLGFDLGCGTLSV